ncbi:hypothetical protein [Alkalihalobacterium elongatum]|uniref:hypothetical protein n=1 Tax=Alkalihalobacterium elongatum TaxID=2675466 RepID=UPI001C1F87E7|nr:hypothetical protein [Alkalihalobacterium elongatum]
MIEIRTFISKNNIWFNEKLSETDFEKQYIDFEDMEKEKEIKVALRYLNDNLDFSPKGFIRITLNEQEIIGENEFGNLNELWETYITLLTAYLKEGRAIEYFDFYYKMITLQTYDETRLVLQLSFVREDKGAPELSNSLIKEFSLPKDAFTVALLKAACTYYETMLKYKDNEKLKMKHKGLFNLYRSYGV